MTTAERYLIKWNIYLVWKTFDLCESVQMLTLESPIVHYKQIIALTLTVYKNIYRVQNISLELFFCISP